MFRTCDLDQPFLLPPSLQDWLPENHLARFVAELANGLDLSNIYGFYGRRDGRGMAAYHPVTMVRLLLYGYCRPLLISPGRTKLALGSAAASHLGSPRRARQCFIPTGS